jgi:hypothetical protein
MKKLLIVGLMIGLFAGCTAPTQPIAVQALDIGTKQAHNVFYDMSRIARQNVLDRGGDAAQSAAEAGDAQAARQAVKDTFDSMNTIDWLHIQWERSRAFIRIGQQYVWEQKGIANLMAEEIQKAMDDAEKNREEPTP